MDPFWYITIWYITMAAAAFLLGLISGMLLVHRYERGPWKRQTPAERKPLPGEEYLEYYR